MSQKPAKSEKNPLGSPGARHKNESLTKDNMGNLPEEKEILAKLGPLSEQLGLKKDQLEKMTLQQKWLLVLQYQEKAEDSSSQMNKPADVLKELEKGKSKLKTLIRVRTLLATESVDWVSEFIKLKGHEKIFDMFHHVSEKRVTDKERELLAELCRCMRALMNTSEGFQKALEWNESIPLMVQAMPHINIVSQSLVLYVLAAVGVVSHEGHLKLLLELRKLNMLPTLMENLRLKDPELNTATLTFINAIINGISDTETRVTVRNEFIKMNIKDYLKNFLAREEQKQDLLVQIKVFEDGLESDRGNLTGTGGIDQKDWENAQTLIESLKEKLEKLQKEYGALEFEKRHLQEELEKLKTQIANGSIAVGSGGGDVVGGGGPPPPPPPGGVSSEAGEALTDGGPPPPPPPPGMGGDGGPPPPPPPPGGDGGPPPPPPPPGMGGPPPPPPPPGMGGPPPPPGAPAKSGRPAKAKRKPNKKMKGFVWNKIADAKVDGTIWEKTDDSKFRIDTAEFEGLFGEREREEKPMGGGADGSPALSKAGAKQKVVLLDPKRSNNCSIMLRGLKLSPTEIKNAILDFNEKVLSEDALRSMRDFVPTPEELQMIKEYPGDKNDLADAEKFFLEISTVTGLASKINGLLFKVQFSDKADAAKQEINILDKAIESTRKNTKLIQLLEIVLALGNYLNGQNNRGGAYGFRLNALPKLSDVKANDGKTTLMHYVGDLLEKKHKELLPVIEELSHTHEAARLSIRETMSKVKELSTGFASIDAQLNDPNGDAKFKSVMGAFVSKAKETLQQIEDRGTKLEPAFKETLAFYGEPPATETEDFFGTWSAFVNGLNKARQDNQKRVELQAKEEKTRALQAELKKQVGVGGLKKKGQLEEAIQDLQSGKLFARLSVRLDGPVKLQ